MGGVILKNTKELINYSLFIGFTLVMTMVIQIPAPAGIGYLNLGDMVIFLAAIIFGKKGGFIVGAFGSSLADILLGWGFYAPITFIVKGFEGYLAGYLLNTSFGKKNPIIPLLISGLFMALGYYLAESIIYGHMASIINLPSNILQGTFGGFVAIQLYNFLKKSSFMTEKIKL